MDAESMSNQQSHLWTSNQTKKEVDYSFNLRNNNATQNLRIFSLKT